MVYSKRHRRSALKGTSSPPPLILRPLKFSLAGSIPKPLVPTIFPSLGDSPPPAQQPQGWAGAIFSLGTELILTHPQGTWGPAAGWGGGGKTSPGKLDLRQGWSQVPGTLGMQVEAVHDSLSLRDRN